MAEILIGIIHEFFDNQEFGGHLLFLQAKENDINIFSNSSIVLIGISSVKVDDFFYLLTYLLSESQLGLIQGNMINGSPMKLNSFLLLLSYSLH